MWWAVVWELHDDGWSPVLIIQLWLDAGLPAAQGALVAWGTMGGRLHTLACRVGAAQLQWATSGRTRAGVLKCRLAGANGAIAEIWRETWWV